MYAAGTEIKGLKPQIVLKFVLKKRHFTKLRLSLTWAVKRLTIIIIYIYKDLL